MAIKSDTFSRVELTDADAARFVRHMREDEPNPKAQASYLRGLEFLRQVLNSKPADRAR